MFNIRYFYGRQAEQGKYSPSRVLRFFLGGTVCLLFLMHTVIADISAVPTLRSLLYSIICLFMLGIFFSLNLQFFSKYCGKLFADDHSAKRILFGTSSYLLAVSAIGCLLITLYQGGVLSTMYDLLTGVLVENKTGVTPHPQIACDLILDALRDDDWDKALTLMSEFPTPENGVYFSRSRVFLWSLIFGSIMFLCGFIQCSTTQKKIAPTHTTTQTIHE